MIKRLIVINIFSLFFFNGFAQTNEDLSLNSENSTDTLLSEEESHLLMFSVGYSSNNTKNKNFLDIKMPTVTTDAYFFAKNGIWSSVAYSHYIDASENTYETEFSLGYQTYFFNILDVDLSYSFHQFKGDTLYSGIDYDHAFVLSTGLDFNFINFYVDNSVFVGSTNNYFLDLSLGFNLEDDDFLFKNDNISFSPTLISSFGTNDFIYIDIIPRFRIRRGELVRVRSQIVETTESEFVFQNYGAMFPLIYSIGNFSFTVAWSYISPSERLKEIGWDDQNVFFISLAYIPNIF